MGIRKLEDATVRTIGASQVLTDPAAVVKELIDNAIDANATSIAVEIHHNTLDVIQVRDNGHGIAPEDRAMVARPNCTSKLVGIDDLSTVGGSSLGFRGQALASTAELCGSMTISTRVEGETVATALKINQRGEVAGQERTSLPVGTAVRITDWMKTNPVRKQVALKNTEKCLKNIKQILQAYALARLSVRLSLRVLKAKNQKGSWTYAPKPSGSVEDAALKVVSSACASQCTWSVVEERGFTLGALIPRPDVEVTKISNIGAFVSVDARPVSSARGTTKEVIKIFRESLKSAHPTFDGVKDPFIYMQIACPPASYDPNVEPCKDDVLFEDANTVIRLARKLFNAVYLSNSTLETTPEQISREAAPASPPQQSLDDEDDFMTCLETAEPTGLPVQSIYLDPETTQQQLQISSDRTDEQRPSWAQRAPKFNIYRRHDGGPNLTNVQPPTRWTEADFEQTGKACTDINVYNPRVTAKMDPFIGSNGAPQTTGDRTREAEIRTSAQSPPARYKQRHTSLNIFGLSTPRPSSPPPPAEGYHLSDQVSDISDDCPIGASSLPPQHVKRPQPPSPAHHGMDVSIGERSSGRLSACDRALTVNGTEPPDLMPLHAIPEARQRSRRSPRKQLPLESSATPVVDQRRREKVWFDHLEDMTSPKRRPRRPYQPTNSDGLVHQGELGDLLDEPRPLTPPKRNRDIREFVGSVNPTARDLVSSFVERRNHSQTRPQQFAGADDSHIPAARDEKSSSGRGVLSGRGFVPATEIAAMEARFGTFNKEVSRPPKRRKRSRSRVLREVSGNIPSFAGNTEEDDGSITDGRAATRRRHASEDSGNRKTSRTKSSSLLLERVPPGQGMHNVQLLQSTSVQDISNWSERIDRKRTLLGWNEPALDAHNAFATPPTDSEVQHVVAKLHELLLCKVSNGEMVQDLGMLVQRALTAHVKTST